MKSQIIHELSVSQIERLRINISDEDIHRQLAEKMVREMPYCDLQKLIPMTVIDPRKDLYTHIGDDISPSSNEYFDIKDTWVKAINIGCKVFKLVCDVK